MIIPIRELIDYNGNVYTLTCAIVKRAVQITVTGDDDLDTNEGKVVSTAINQVLTKKVDYRLEA
jgi:DNA-directed RNA polymerase subunit omega